MSTVPRIGHPVIVRSATALGVRMCTVHFLG